MAAAPSAPNALASVAGFASGRRSPADGERRFDLGDRAQAALLERIPEASHQAGSSAAVGSSWEKATSWSRRVPAVPESTASAARA